MNKEHHYRLSTEWTGNTGNGTSSYRVYERSVTISVKNKADILCSSDTTVYADKTKHNPEELLLAAISGCHLLWYLHVCSEAKVNVLEYIDNATAIMMETKNGGGHFTEVTLRPAIVVSEASMIESAKALHKKAGELCYIANSCNFPIYYAPIITIKVE